MRSYSRRGGEEPDIARKTGDIQDIWPSSLLPRRPYAEDISTHEAV